MPNIAMRRKSNADNGSSFRNPTPQGKIIDTTTKFGAKGVKKNQGSTIIKYDILPFAQGIQPIQVFTFFENAQTRQFPFTNLTDGKLQVGEAMVIERMYFYIVTQTIATGAFANVQSIEEFAVPGAYGGTFNFTIANSQVLKPNPITSFKSAFNKNANYAFYNVFHFDTDIVIPTLIEFACNLKTPIILAPVSAANNFFIGCAIEGTGAILAPRTTF